MKAFLFPGQGSQTVGMGLEEYQARGAVRDLYDRASSVLGYRLKDVMFEGPAEKLTATEHAQPALFVHSFGLYQLLENPQPGMAAGHSLGEYTALAVAQAITFDDALRLVDERARAMAEAGSQNPGTMGAVVGLEDEVVAEICATYAEESGHVVVPANYNSDGQVVISGSVEGVKGALARASEGGAKLAREINVSGAFHSPLMEGAAERLAAALNEAPIQDAHFPVWMNAVARPVTDGEEIRELLLAQLTSPVRWTASVRGMIEAGATEFVEVGAGNVLRKLVGRISRDVTASGISSLANVDTFNGNSENQTPEG